MASFEIISDIMEVEVIAIGKSNRDLPRLRKLYGDGRWRKMKGIALIKLRNGHIHKVELHCYEAHGVGRKEYKRKRYLE